MFIKFFLRCRPSVERYFTARLGDRRRHEKVAEVHFFPCIFLPRAVSCLGIAGSGKTYDNLMEIHDE